VLSRVSLPVTRIELGVLPPTAFALQVAQPALRAMYRLEPGIVDGKRALVTSVRRNIRELAEAELDWNLLKYTSLSIKYKYGAEPPLFPLVDHQMMVGVTVKAAQRNRP
jgi:hypothetical protein